MRLYLSGREIHELYMMYKDRARLFVFKVPCNYDIEFLQINWIKRMDQWIYMIIRRWIERAEILVVIINS